MVPIDYNGFRASFTPNSYFSRETWKRLLNLECVKIQYKEAQVGYDTRVTHLQNSKRATTPQIKPQERDLNVTWP